jgi:hypothetical protein
MSFFSQAVGGDGALQHQSTGRQSSFYHIFVHDTWVMPNRPTRPRTALRFLKGIVELMAQRRARGLVNDEGVELECCRRWSSSRCGNSGVALVQQELPIQDQAARNLRELVHDAFASAP